MIPKTIMRKSLLYKSKVEYGGWTVNHILGCAHGCRYPCYAMTLSKRTGRISSYSEWLQPRVVSNALELLDDELKRYAGNIDSVHLCFTTDPFMYNRELEQPLQHIADTSMAIIRRLNKDGIPVTTLTKGIYPPELETSISELHPDNQYGISLVSLSESYRRQWEPGAACASARISSLRQLASMGAHTWISIEPYPTPNIDEMAPCVTTLLDKIVFAEKIVFGKWNYNRLATEYDREYAFYAGIVPHVLDWCGLHQMPLHIKAGTPQSSSSGHRFFKVALTNG